MCLDKHLNVLDLCFLICEIRWDKIISVSPLVLKFHDSVIEMRKTFNFRVEFSGREQSFQKVPQFTLWCSLLVLFWYSDRIIDIYEEQNHPPLTELEKVLILFISSLSSTVHDGWEILAFYITCSCFSMGNPGHLSVCSWAEWVSPREFRELSLEQGGSQRVCVLSETDLDLSAPY